jgi:very-short-patch-repair endonuclease
VRTWADLPVGRVIRLDGTDTESTALAIDPLPTGAPAIVTYHAGASRSTTRMVASLLQELEEAAISLFPAWLPEAEGISGAGGAGLPAVRVLAQREAAASDHFGPFLARLAELALAARGGPGTDGSCSMNAPGSMGAPGSMSASGGMGGFSPEVRAAGLARVLAASFGRTRAAVLVHVPAGLTPVAQEVLVGGCEWLAHRGRLGVWLTGGRDEGDPLTAVDRLERVTIHLPPGEAADPVAVADEATAGGLRYPALAGRPHPGSRSEQALEAALARCDWAAGRVWNQTYQRHPLAAPIRVDLLWRDERCVVEVDGPDHRRRLKFADDRRRDVHLQLAGYAVLRFTDAHVLTDTEVVVRQIERFLRNRRHGPMEG